MIDSSSDTVAVTEVIRRGLKGGGSIEELRRRRKAVSNQLRLAVPEVIVSSCQLLLRNGDLPAWLLFEIINNDRRVLAKMTKEQVEDLGVGIASWAAVDIFACYVAGPASIILESRHDTQKPLHGQAPRLTRRTGRSSALLK